MNQPKKTLPEFSHKHIGAIPRQKSMTPHVEQIGCLKKPINWRQKDIKRLHISILIHGSGTYKDIKGRKINVKGPALILYKPEDIPSFEPDDYYEKWLEYYFIYQPNSLKAVLQQIDSEDPITSFCLTKHIMGLLMHIDETQKNLHILGSVDRLDMLSQAIFTESFLQLNKHLNPTLNRILQIRKHLERNVLSEINFEEIADSHNMSMVTLRRHWSTWIGESPNRYIHNLRMQHAVHLIVNTELPLGVIAQRIGFKDPLYFSRRFHSFAGMPASEYRKLYKTTES